MRSCWHYVWTTARPVPHFLPLLFILRRTLPFILCIPQKASAFLKELSSTLYEPDPLLQPLGGKPGGRRIRCPQDLLPRAQSLFARWKINGGDGVDPIEGDELFTMLTSKARLSRGWSSSACLRSLKSPDTRHACQPSTSELAACRA
jgi:hypothetical protein